MVPNASQGYSVRCEIPAQADYLEEHVLISHTDQSAHPVVLFVMYFFRIAAIATYILCGFFTDNYVISVRSLSARLLPANSFMLLGPRL
jgi:hypothetical protein